MGMLILVCFILAGIVLISIIRMQKAKSQIGEEGKRNW